METVRTTVVRWLAVVCLVLAAGVRSAGAQGLRPDSADLRPDSALTALTDSIEHVIDSVLNQPTAVRAAGGPQPVAASRPRAPRRDWAKWVPDPKRAMWLGLVIPGGGQIYNRKYWKLPIVYGGFMGCVYAMNWNNNMYKSYAQAYLDLMDDDPGTASYNQFLHLGRQIDSSNETRYKEIFRKRKDKFRRWRDMSFFALIGVYAVSVIDAYVDAELSVFDISKDLSLKVEPTILNGSPTASPLQASSLGVQCSINF